MQDLGPKLISDDRPVERDDVSLPQQLDFDRLCMGQSPQQVGDVLALRAAPPEIFQRAINRPDELLVLLGQEQEKIEHVLPNIQP